ncbi:helix-turn-helix domain-containing protein [Qipengyuania sp. MTN3-11]|uniref:helix-turn-helix domain-containing protein n=1 Tax=Qipengyuania sp. MTN3-11 TaxID=3056557 RepID=UPI0036F2EE56
MSKHSQIANINARANFRRVGNYLGQPISQNADMADSTEKNGGPNHLRAWMDYRGVKGVELAERLGGNVTPGMVSDLANSNRALSAKWLRRLADALSTTPGLLLDHDPRELDADLLETWLSANDREKKQITDIAKTLVRSGTDG